MPIIGAPLMDIVIILRGVGYTTLLEYRQTVVYSHAPIGVSHEISM